MSLTLLGSGPATPAPPDPGAPSLVSISVSASGTALVTVWNQTVNFIGNGAIVLTFADNPDNPFSFGEGFTGSGTTTLTVDLMAFASLKVQMGDVLSADVQADFAESVAEGLPNIESAPAVANNSLITPILIGSATSVDAGTLDIKYSGAVTVSGIPDLRLGTGAWITRATQPGSKTVRVSNKSFTGSTLAPGAVLNQGWRDAAVRGVAQGAYVQAGQVVIQAP